MRTWFIVIFGLLTPAFSVAGEAPLRVAMLSDVGVAGNGPKMIEQHFAGQRDFQLVKLRSADIRAGKLDEYDVLIVPGGVGQTMAAGLDQAGRKAIKKFVADGGTYIGICAGCYLASAEYPWSLHILPVTIVDKANWQRGQAELTIELTEAGKTCFGRKEASLKILYHNGPVLQPKDDAKVIPLATFKDEVAKKGTKTGLMTGTSAIVAARFEKGWVVGISPHPEQTEGLKDFLPAAIRWTREKK